MIENLPKQITLENLNNFNFGDIEGNDDTLLFDSVCKTSAINEFLQSKKNIVLGEKGTGKTALFRLLKEKKLHFKQSNGYKNIIIPIEDNFHYKSIKSKLLNLIEIDSEEEEFKYQIVWELFLFKKICAEIDKLEVTLNREINEAIKLSKELLGSQELEKLFKSNYTFGVKLYDTSTQILPDFYISSEAKELDVREKKSNDLKKLEIDLDLHKENINSFLIENELNIIILIDRLDEFVSKVAQKAQIEMLEALIAVEREYNRYSNIELKIFLRDDLFKELNFDGIGYDKVTSKKVDLIWTPEKIREFIAKRIYYNYKNIFHINNLLLTVNKENLEIDTSVETENYVKPNFISKYYRKFLKRIDPEKYALKYPRKINLNDDLNKQIILSIFPKYVEYKNEDSKLEEIEIFDYFSTNFNLGTGNTIPRLILIFLDILFLNTKNYYSENTDQTPFALNQNKCYEIFKRGFFNDAFEKFKEEIHINFSKLNPDFESTINLFHEKIGNRYSFRAKELKSILSIKDDIEIFHFCEYLLHIGYITRTNSSSTIENMKFELVNLFRKK